MTCLRSGGLWVAGLDFLAGLFATRASGASSRLLLRKKGLESLRGTQSTQHCGSFETPAPDPNCSTQLCPPQVSVCLTLLEEGVVVGSCQGLEK